MTNTILLFAFKWMLDVHHMNVNQDYIQTQNICELLI